jgi:glycosyltransferase involved in cell wall biosynthesis/spore maturation protein CgeB
MVGDGQIRNGLEALVDEHDLREKVRFTGRVPHEEVNRYHSIIDIAPFPRTPDIVCEFISPLKPFESMAMGQVVVGSNVAALKEIIVDGEHGRLFRKGDSHHLYEVLESILSQPKEMAQLRASGLAWVKKHRDWNSLASYLNKVHEAVLHGGSRPELLGDGQALTVHNGKVSSVIDGTPTVLAIMDEFSSTALSADANLLQPTPESWQTILDQHQVDLLIVESAWVGNNGSWHRKVGWYSEDEIAELKALVNACRERNIPSVFYNKEDPVHFNRFSKTSALFDHVFTTDVGCIPRYEALEGSSIQSVDSIQFAAQPNVHHPYNTKLQDRNDIAFAGTYYAGKYPERCKKMDMLFDASVEHGLVIYDRQSDGGNPQYVFPERFTEHIHGKLEYQDMLNKHREHMIFLNVNSVEDSPTMAARRIFEIPASGACLVSGPGLAVREVFGNIVPIVYSSEQANETLAALMADEKFLRYTIQSSRLIVLKEHLNNHRLQKMLIASSLSLQRSSSVPQTVIVSDKLTSIRDICLWFTRQEIHFRHLVLPSIPTTKAEELLVTLLQNRGLTVSFEQAESTNSPTIQIHKVAAFVHQGLDALFSEIQSTAHTIHFKSSSGELLATCKQPDSKIEVILEHFVPFPPPEKLISTITEHTFTKVPSTILIAGHDLKFAMPIVEVMEEMGIRVLIDKWDNHNKFNAEKSRTLLEEADAVWCEWALGNVQWYSHAIELATPLFVRYHLQERNYDYLKDSKQEAISNLAFVCKHYEENARAIGQIPKTTKTSVIPNSMNIRGTYPRKNDNYSIGFVGMIPARKRLDLALDLLEELLAHDLRYKLKVVGKNPEEYSWLMKRDDEREYYQTIRTRLESNPLLKSRVEFLGFVDDIREFYSSVGHVISTSDFESYHLTLADGPIHGAAAHTLRWDGSKDIYTDIWLHNSVKSISSQIISLNNQNKTAFLAHQQSLHLASQMNPEIIALSIVQALEVNRDEF